jgi:hypothetical protein
LRLLKNLHLTGHRCLDLSFCKYLNLLRLIIGTGRNMDYKTCKFQLHKSSDPSSLCQLPIHQHDLYLKLQALLTALSIQRCTSTGAPCSRAGRGTRTCNNTRSRAAARWGVTTSGLVGADDLIDLVDHGDHLNA